MKYITIIGVLLVLASCGKKDTYGYNCNCTDKKTAVQDTFYSIRVQTSGEATFLCNEYQDTANSRGKNISCKID